MPGTDRIIRTLAALDEAEVRHCVLRGLPAAAGGAGAGVGGEAEPVLEVDLLVGGTALSRCAAAVRRCGYARLPSWGYDGHHFFVAFDQTAGCWLKLDVVTRLQYGRRAADLCRLELADACLEARRREEGVWVPAVEHELVTLLLHCLLDKRRFDARHRRRLEELCAATAVAAAGDEVAGGRARRGADAWLGEALTRDEVAGAVRSGDWTALLERRRAVVAALRRRPRGAAFARRCGRPLRRVLRPLVAALQRRGAVVALLGPDGAGKSTLAQALVDDRQLQARRVYLGGSRAARAGAGRAAAGRRGPARPLRFGRRLLVQCARSLAAAGHRWRGRCVACDRHPWEGLVDAAATAGRRRGARWRRWLLAQLCVRPDLVIILDAPGHLLFERSGQHDPGRLEQQRRRYRQLDALLRARRAPAVVLDARPGADRVRRQVKALVWSVIQPGGGGSLAPALTGAAAADGMDGSCSRNG